jgi:DNA-binding NarL/FixJ family response regulator
METPIDGGSVRGVRGNASHAATDRVAERRRAVALAGHYREFQGLTIQQIADRLGRAPATVKAYFYDPSKVTKKLYGPACAAKPGTASSLASSTIR